jgi:serine/threonine-protein kinase RsbW
VDPENRSTLEHVFPARLSALPRLVVFIAETAARASVPAATCQKLTLLVEELFTNTIVHGHRQDSDAPVRVELSVEPGQITLTYEDTAPPYDPFVDVRRPDETARVEERQVGGLGLFLIATLAQNMEYCRAEDRNRIRLVVTVP